MPVDLLAFPLVGGRLALNFVGTLGKRTTERFERMRTPEDLAHWVELAGLGSVSTTAEDLMNARAVREALYSLTLAALNRGPLRQADINLVNGWAARATPAPALATGVGQADGVRANALQRQDPEPSASGVLAVVARDGIELLSGPEVEAIRECEDPACTLLFVDSSRGRRRRWCSMNSCGARAKMRTLRDR
ncbi:CGNR zinc finger domain-containing protein [Kribbella ginsengisoli]|uniref:CGNR zinc finger domain-containing protein n=1 Tax=Kribbella ginsengisoli TaxID=363865 RepID=A0ABP6XJU4_9ACTN